MLDTIAGTKLEYKSAKKLISSLITFIGFLIFGFTLKQAIIEYVSFSNIKNLISFILPLILSIFYTPIAYAFYIYAKYEIIFIQMSFKEMDDKKIHRMHCWKVFKACKLSYSKINILEHDIINKMYKTMSNKDFDIFIKNFLV